MGILSNCQARTPIASNVTAVTAPYQATFDRTECARVRNRCHIDGKYGITTAAMHANQLTTCGHINGGATSWVIIPITTVEQTAPPIRTQLFCHTYPATTTSNATNNNGASMGVSDQCATVANHPSAGINRMSGRLCVRTRVNLGFMKTSGEVGIMNYELWIMNGELCIAATHIVPLHLLSDHRD